MSSSSGRARRCRGRFVLDEGGRRGREHIRGRLGRRAEGVDEGGEGRGSTLEGGRHICVHTINFSPSGKPLLHPHLDDGNCLFLFFANATGSKGFSDGPLPS